MRKSILIVISFIFLVSCNQKPKTSVESQDIYKIKNEVSKLLNEGVKLHDSGEFENAIHKYKQALKLDPKNETGLYEISHTLIAKGKPKVAEKYIDRGIALKGKILAAFYMLKGTSLDIQKKPEKSIEFYLKAEKLNKTDYLIPFNMGVTYINLNNLNNAKKSFEKAINLNPIHSSSHFYLGLIYENNNEDVKAMFAFARFCSLENNTERSGFAISKIEKIFNKGVEKTGEENGKKTISINVADLLGGKKDDIYSQMRLFLKMSGALRIGEDQEKKGLTNFDLLAGQFKRFLEYFSEISESESPKDFFWKTYSPYFLALLKNDYSKQLSVFLFSKSEYDNAKKWADNNLMEMQSFYRWNEKFNNQYR